MILSKIDKTRLLDYNMGMKTFGKYILRGKEVVPCDDLFRWAQWFEVAYPAGDTIVNGLLNP